MPPEQVVEALIPTLFTKSVSIDVIDEIAAIISEFHPAGMRAMKLAFTEVRSFLRTRVSCLMLIKEWWVGDLCPVRNYIQESPLKGMNNYGI